MIRTTAIILFWAITSAVSAQTDTLYGWVKDYTQLSPDKGEVQIRLPSGEIATYRVGPRNISKWGRAFALAGSRAYQEEIFIEFSVAGDLLWKVFNYAPIPISGDEASTAFIRDSTYRLQVAGEYAILQTSDYASVVMEWDHIILIKLGHELFGLYDRDSGEEILRIVGGNILIPSTAKKVE